MFFNLLNISNKYLLFKGGGDGSNVVSHFPFFKYNVAELTIIYIW